MRLFLVAYPSIETVEYFRQVRSSFTKFKNEIIFLEPNDIYLPFHFLGRDISTESYERVLHSLKSLLGQSYSFEMSLSGFQLGLPFQRRPRMILYELEGSDEYAALQKDIRDSLRSLELEDLNSSKIKLDSYPHFKIGNIKERVSKSIIHQIEDIFEAMEPLEEKAFPITKLVLMESLLNRKGQKIYRRWDEIGLKYTT